MLNSFLVQLVYVLGIDFFVAPGPKPRPLLRVARADCSVVPSFGGTGTYLSHRVTHLASLSLFRVTLNPKPSHTTTDHGCSIFPY